MGLLGNFSRIYIGRTAEGSAHALLPSQHNDYSHHEDFIGRDGEVTTDKRLARPSGYYLPDVYDAPISIGDMSMVPEGTGTLTATLYASKNMTVAMTGGGTLEATASLVIAMIAAMTGGGSLTASIQGRANTSVSFTGGGNLTADISALAGMILSLTGGGDLAATIAGIANMAIDITVTSGLTATSIAESVWESVTASHNTSGTMGEVMNVITAATYTAKVILLDDDAGAADRYVVSWFKNGAPIASVPTTPLIQVVKIADGSNLIASTAMTQIGSTADLRYTASGGERVVSGVGYIAVATGTIDGSARTWKQPVGRDAS